jgi:hypothetical protein
LKLFTRIQELVIIIKIILVQRATTATIYLINVHVFEVKEGKCIVIGSGAVGFAEPIEREYKN